MSSVKKINPYEKIFDDAKRLINNKDSKLHKLKSHKDSTSKSIQIPFPYGGRGNKTYKAK